MHAQNDMMRVPFNRPYTTGREAATIADAIARGHLSGDGHYTHACEDILGGWLGAPALLTPSCTAALEMMPTLLDLQPGDEVILPSFTFVSSANAFVLRGVTPVFADISADTLTIDPASVEAAITDKTRAILIVHYAGVSCDLDSLLKICRERGIVLLEDAAHCFNARFRGKELGSFGALGALSFHETKNIIAGEGGALIVGDLEILPRAEVVRQKGTNRKSFFEGKVDKYTWVDVGSSFLPSDLTAAFLHPQLEDAREITDRRLAIWNGYHKRLSNLEKEGVLRRPIVPENCEHNAHIYYVLLDADINRARVLSTLQDRGVGAIFHYVPLHSSPAGLHHCRTPAPLTVTDDIASRIVRLPIWVGMTDPMIDYVCEQLAKALG